MWSRSQSFPDSQKFSTTSLFDNYCCRRFVRVGRSRIGKGFQLDRKTFSPRSNGGTGEPHPDNPEDFPECETSREKSGSWLSYVQPIPHLINISSSRSLSVAHRSRPREDPRRRYASSHGSRDSQELISRYACAFFFFFFFCSIDRRRSIRKSELNARREPVCDRAEKNAWCRWSTTAEDHF